MWSIGESFILLWPHLFLWTGPDNLFKWNCISSALCLSPQWQNGPLRKNPPWCSTLDTPFTLCITQDPDWYQCNNTLHPWTACCSCGIHSQVKTRFNLSWDDWQVSYKSTGNAKCPHRDTSLTLVWCCVQMQTITFVKHECSHSNISKVHSFTSNWNEVVNSLKHLAPV